MTTGPFAPTPFTNPVIAPNAVSVTRRVPYVSISEFSAAPTAIQISSLVTGGTSDQNNAEAYNVLLRASDAVDLLCFHDPGGTLAASPTYESGWITPKPSGDLWLQCNYRPILAVLGVALGSSPTQLQNIGDAAAANIDIQDTIIMLSSQAGYIQPSFTATALQPPTRRGRTYVSWSYLNGFPHCVLAEDALQGDTTITVASGVPGGSSPYGIYPGTQLSIRDAGASGGVEEIIVASVSGNVLTLTSPLVYDHDVPDPPDSVMVTAVPEAIEQATISMAAYLIKLRGSRAAVMASIASGKTNGPKLQGQAGSSDDFDTAKALLQPFTTVYRRNSAA